MNGEAMVDDGYNPSTGETQLAIANALRTGRVRASSQNTPPGASSKTSEEEANAAPSTTHQISQDPVEDEALGTA